MPTAVTAVPPAPSDLARQHFAAEPAFETGCWDVHDALARGADFVFLDVRGPALFDAGHVPGAVHLPHGKIVRSALERWPDGMVFVTYCAGPHCNGAARGALRIADRYRFGVVTRSPRASVSLYLIRCDEPSACRAAPTASRVLPNQPSNAAIENAASVR